MKNTAIAFLFLLLCYSMWNTYRATTELKRVIRMQQACVPVVRVVLKNSLGSLPQPPAPDEQRSVQKKDVR